MKFSLPFKSNGDVRLHSSVAGYELSAVEVDAVHGGALNVEISAYIPMSTSHPKTETTLPRVPYK